MRAIYRVTIHGRTLESADVRKLLARAVVEKRNMDRVFRCASNAGTVRVASRPTVYAVSQEASERLA
jgi:hypothetical protein